MNKDRVSEQPPPDLTLAFAAALDPEMDRLDAITDGHHRLLETFRDFSLGLDLVETREPDIAELRAAVSFLRHEVLPFARWEEEVLASVPEAWEVATFEHAFLNVEIDALAKSVDALAEMPSDEAWGERRKNLLLMLLRRIHRIEIILEFHLLRGDDTPVDLLH